ncbi:MAG: Sir2 family NAD-dependent protein deacetylase [Arcobacteraceae bacterium]
MKNNILKAKQHIEKADAILITAGAGMGVDSGLPDFRGNLGFWKAYPPMQELELDFTDMANPHWFESNPSFAWAFYGHRLNLYRETIPHKGFDHLLKLIKEKKENYFIYTSNVDGQFQKAGFDEDKIYEVHGSIHHLQCSKRCSDELWDNDEYIEVDMEKFDASNIPLCEKCGEVARPNILMFGDWHWNSKRAAKQEYDYNRWIKRNRHKNLLIIEVGAGTAIPTIRLQGEHLAKYYNNTNLIRINPRDFEIDEKLGVSLALGGIDGIESILL